LTDLDIIAREVSGYRTRLEAIEKYLSPPRSALPPSAAAATDRTRNQEIIMAAQRPDLFW
jgi:hypothetical protein